MMRRLRWIVPALLLAACGSLAPAATPAHLEHTPGPPVILTGSIYDAGVFSLRYPSGWRIVTGAASSPAWVGFVSPDEDAVLVFSAAPLDDVPRPPALEADAQAVTDQRSIQLGEITLYAGIIAGMDAGPAALALFEHMLATARPGD